MRLHWIRAGLALALVSSPAWAAKVTLGISSLPADTPSDATITLGANINNWKADDPAFRFVKNERGAYSITLDVPDGALLEYKVTLGSWANVEKAADGGELPNRMVRALGDTTVEFKVARWASTTVALAAPKSGTITGTVERLEQVFSPQLENNRDVLVYLPPSYATNPNKRYPVLYAHDGQNLFDAATSNAGEWNADETAEALAKRGLEAIIVGIPNKGVERMAEYSPFPDPETRMVAKGEAYALFVTLTLKPLIDSKYRTLIDREHTGLVGSSMGGLISLYTALRFPETYSFAGALSPAFWIGNYSMISWVKAHPNPGVRVWIDMGTEEGSGMLLGAQWMTDVLRSQGNEVRLMIEKGAKHDEAAWRGRFPAVLEWFHAAPLTRITPEASAMLEKAVVARGGAAFKGMRSLRIRMLVTQYVQSTSGPTPVQPFEMNVLIDPSSERIRAEYLDESKVVMIQQAAVPTREAFVWTIDRGLQRVPYEVLSDLVSNLYAGIVGLSFGADRREAVLLEGSQRMLGLNGQCVAVSTHGVFAEYLFAPDGTMLAERRVVPGGNPQTNVYGNYHSINGVSFPFEIKTYLDQTLISSFKLLEVQINLMLDQNEFKLP